MSILAEIAATLPPEEDPPATPRHSDKITDEQAAWLIWYMTRARAHSNGLQSHPFTEESGAVRAAAYDCEYRVYLAVWQGGDLEPAIAEQDARWRAMAAEQQRKVATAPKVRFAGGSTGQSAAEHVWASPDAFADMAHRIRRNVAHALLQRVPPGAPTKLVEL